MRAVRPKKQHIQAVERVLTAFVPLAGGEDLVSPGASVSPGALSFSLNYEPANIFGYRRIDGFECFDGHPSPSKATYSTLKFDGGTQDFAPGNIITGGTSSATAEVLYVFVTSGTWGGGNAAGTLVIFNVTGTFQNNEAITATGGAAVADGTQVLRGATNDTDDATWLQAAIEATRLDISAVPGSGYPSPWIYKGDKYAIRDNALATAAVLHKATASGWTAVSLGLILDFTSGGTAEIMEGDVIVGATSAATATIKRVVLTSGTWAAGDAAGYLVFATQTGTFQAENLNVGVTLNIATIAGDSAAITLLPGGHYEFINENFYGSTATQRMYWCDGVNKAFEFDGVVGCPVTTGMATDTPIHIAKHKKHLFLAFGGGSVQHSAPGEPLVWNAILGANEIGTGDEVTGMVPATGGVLAIFNRSQTYVLYGSNVSDWDLKLHAPESGAIEWSLQSLFAPRYLDDRGITTLSAVQEFGNFSSGTFSQKIQPLLDYKRAKGTTVISSVVSKSKDQYRIFFSDNTGIVCKFRGNKVEFTRIDLKIPVRSICSGEGADGEEVILFGSDDGFVYQMDAGTSFNGDPVEAYLRIPFGNMRSPQVIKRFFKVVLDIDAPTGSSIEFAQEFDYGNDETPKGVTQNLEANSGGGFWGISEWSTFLWGQQTVGQADAYLDGSGKNMGMFIRTLSTYDEPHTMTGFNVHYSHRGRSR